jgi:hypothetical protein
MTIDDQRMKSMGKFLAILLLASAPAWAQAPAPKAAVPAKSACADCGVVRSVRMMTKESAPLAANDAKPSGLVATVPLGHSDEKAKIGSSSKVGKDVVTRTDRWEVTVLLDDGRYKLVTLSEAPNLHEGDKVRIDENGKVQLRSD